ncbi:kinase D-interacting substrate [Acrasis kona]|uniref:Kinase D-interacting substrate n=1 Tax=Acrasis kona TaxID=1008807 RepID=A0AAW2ZB70_9EUKA
MVPDQDSLKRLLDACTSGDIFMVDDCLSEISDYSNTSTISFKEHNDGTMIHIAAKYNQVELLKYFSVVLEADLDQQDSIQATPLFYACSAGNLEAVCFLCDQGVNVNHKDSYELSPLLMALRENHFKVCDRLFAHPKIDVNLKVSVKGGTVLHYICGCEHGDLSTVNYLLSKRDISIQRFDRNGDTCLSYAVSRPDKMKALCDHAAQNGYLKKLMRSVNQRGQNVFHQWAICDKSHSYTLDVLVEAALRDSYSLLVEVYNQQDKRNLNTPLHCVIKRKANQHHILRCSHYHHFCKLWIINKLGETPLLSAVRRNDIHSVEVLVHMDKFRRTLSIPDNTKLTPLEVSVQKKFSHINKILINASQNTQQNACDLISEHTKKHFFNILLVSNSNLPTNIHDSVDRIYRAGGGVLGVTSDYESHLTHWPYPVIAGLTLGHECDNSPLHRFFKRNLLEKYKRFRMSSRSSFVSPISLPSSKKDSFHSRKANKLINSSNKIKISVLEGSLGKLLFTCQSCVSSEIESLMDVIAFCMYNRFNDGASIECKEEEDVVKWALRDERIAMLFVGAVAEEWNESFPVDFEKLLKSAIDEHCEDIRVLELYKNYMRCRGGVVTCNDVRRDAFYCFIKNEQN